MQLKYTLWIDRVRIKNSLGTFPYLLDYGKEHVFPMNLKIPIMKFTRGYVENEDRIQIQLMNLLELDEKCMATLEHVRVGLGLGIQQHTST